MLQTEKAHIYPFRRLIACGNVFTHLRQVLVVVIAVDTTTDVLCIHHHRAKLQQSEFYVMKSQSRLLVDSVQRGGATVPDFLTGDTGFDADSRRGTGPNEPGSVRPKTIGDHCGLRMKKFPFAYIMLFMPSSDT